MHVRTQMLGQGFESVVSTQLCDLMIVVFENMVRACRLAAPPNPPPPALTLGGIWRHCDRPNQIINLTNQCGPVVESEIDGDYWA